jgi:hypothetical protein
MKHYYTRQIMANIVALCLGGTALATDPIKVDIDMSGRNSSEVTETGYNTWVPSTTNTLTVNGVTFTLSNTSSTGELSTTWYKVGVQSPNYAKLVCDGAYIKDGNNSSGLLLSISGLSAGTHTLQTYHNAVDDYSSSTLSDMDIYVNGSKTSTITPSKRALSTDATKTAYLTFNVTKGQTVQIKFQPNTSKSVNSYNVYLNGFALDVPNAANQASGPTPTDADMHVAADAGSLTMSWTAASNAKSHNVYFGTDSATVNDASTNSAAYKKNQTSTSYAVTGLNNLTTYYWRIDEVDNSGKVTKGNVWSYRPRHLAFPEAEGYGMYAIGGRGGKVVHVTNLNDSGAGSFREAMTNDIGPRTIVFDVAGVIVLSSRLTQVGTNVTIAGQTAPGNGICLRAAPVGVGSESICRDIRVRLGSGETYDGLGMAGGQYSIIDHCSIGWTIDEAFSCRNGKNLTLQRTLISEALNIAGHKNYPVGTGHGYAATIGGDIGSFHHNLLAHNSGRNWSMGGGLDGNGYYAGRLDIFNNVVYNWYTRVCDGGAHEVNFVGNYYKRGAASSTDMDYVLKADLEGTGLGSQAYYFHNNILANKDNSTVYDGSDDSKGRLYTLSNGQQLTWDVWNSKAFFSSQANIESARNAYKSVLSDVGCTMPAIDKHDARMVTETLNGTYSCTGSKTQKGGIIDANSESKEDYSIYPSASRESGFDSDGDGMPDWWETFNGFNPKSANGDFSESNGDANGDGYTNLEDYLNWMATPHFETKTGASVTISLADYYIGFTNGNTYTAVSTPANVKVSISGNKATVSATSKGIYYIKIKVTDNTGDNFTRSFGIKVEGEATVSGPATLTKQGAGSSKQTVKKDSAIISFSYAWTNATTVTVSGLPKGITATIDASAKTVTFSGYANDAEGDYTFTISTTGGNPDSTRTGKITIVSSTSAVSTTAVSNSITLAPNPMDNTTDLLITSTKAGKAEWDIKDMDGKTIKRGQAAVNEGKNIITINREQLKTGVYTLRIQNNGIIKYKKLIVR